MGSILSYYEEAKADPEVVPLSRVSKKDSRLLFVARHQKLAETLEKLIELPLTEGGNVWRAVLPVDS